MALTALQVQQYTDSLAKGCDDFNSAFLLNTAVNTPLYSTIIAGIGGTGVSQTLGRTLNWLDLASEVAMLGKTQATANAVAAYISSIRSLAGYYQQLYGALNALDLLLVGGLNTFLTANSLQINGYVANAFNNFATTAVSGGLRQVSPIQIATANYFPYAAVDDLWDIMCSSASGFSTNAVGSNPSTSVAGGGIAQLFIYKVNPSNAVGGATLIISYTNASGSTSQATYNTSAGTPSASGSLATGFTIVGAIGSAVIGITGSGMTSGEQYRIGARLVRSPSY
jgi:hypothetical protein